MVSVPRRAGTRPGVCFNSSMPLSATVHGSGRPVVLLSGFGLDGAVMAAACEPAFARAEASTREPVRRIYVDLPGTGGSAGVEPTSEAVLAAVRHTVAELIGATPYCLVGHSYGGYIAAGLARRTPSGVAGLLLVCSGVRILPADRDLSDLGLPHTEPGWLDGVPPDLREHFTQAVGRQNAGVAGRLSTAFAQLGPVDEPYLDTLRRDGYQLDDERSPASFAGPVSLLAGRSDRMAGYRDAFAALSGYPLGNYTALAGTGHYLPFEQPDPFAGAVLDWLISTSRS